MSDSISEWQVSGVKWSDEWVNGQFTHSILFQVSDEWVMSEWMDNLLTQIYFEWVPSECRVSDEWVMSDLL